MSLSPASGATTKFAIKFSEQENPEITYMFDSRHFPAPLSKLFQSVMGQAIAQGFTRAVRALDIPIDRAEVTFQNNYLFQARLPVVPKDDVEAIQLSERAESSMQAELPVMIARWEKEHLPRIKANLRRLASMNVEGCARHDLPLLLNEVVAIAANTWKMHYQVAIPAQLASHRFDELFAELIGGSEQDARQLLAGLPTEMKRAAAGLSDLAAAAKAAGLDDLLLSHSAEEMMDALESHPIGVYFAAAVRDYLREFGLRQEHFDLSAQTWLENPADAIAAIQSYLTSGHDARADHERSLTGGVKALNAARYRIKDLPKTIRDQFELLVEVARAANFLEEERHFFIDHCTVAQMHLLFMRLGHRLVASGALAKADDIFMLTINEVKRVSVGMVSEKEIGATHMLVLEREAELERSTRLVPPPYIGTAPVGPPPGGNPMNRAMMQLFGLSIEQSAGANRLSGNAGSRGYVSGFARVARTFDEAQSVQPGEILVAVTTLPTWTPPGTVAALVTETGGPLSHAAIIAREFGIPAVVGATGATRLIQTGQLISVDGSTGMVTIDEA